MTPPINPPILTNKVIEKDPDEIVLLVAGAFLPWYDYSTFFTALKLLIDKGKKSFKVINYGWKYKDPRIDALIRKMGDTQALQKKIVFLQD